MRTGVPCNENRVFPVRIDLQGVPCKPYRVWVCSVDKHNLSPKNCLIEIGASNSVADFKAESTLGADGTKRIQISQSFSY